MFFNDIDEHAIMEDFPLIWLVVPCIVIGLGGRPPQTMRSHNPRWTGCQHPSNPLAFTVGKVTGLLQ
jgi:hypothetical protein